MEQVVQVAPLHPEEPRLLVVKVATGQVAGMEAEAGEVVFPADQEPSASSGPVIYANFQAPVLLMNKEK